MMILPTMKAPGYAFLDSVGRSHDRGPFDGVFHLAYVARQVWAHKAAMADS